MVQRLYTDRLILRDLHVSDADDFFEFAYTDLVGPLAGWSPHKNLAETIRVIHNMNISTEEGNSFNYAIIDKKSLKMIGTIELYNYFPHHKAELGYALNPKFWNQGLVTEAAMAILDYGFNVLKLKRIEAGTYIDNYASQRVCEKIGMTKEGIAKKGYIRYDGVVFDKVVYGITNDEYITR